MKKILLTLIFLLSSKAFAGEIYITVNGMVCGFCAQGIEKSFKKEKNLDKIHVDLANKFVHLILKEKSDIPDSKINQIITEAGFTVEKIERSK